MGCALIGANHYPRRRLTYQVKRCFFIPEYGYRYRITIYARLQAIPAKKRCFCAFLHMSKIVFCFCIKHTNRGNVKTFSRNTSAAPATIRAGAAAAREAPAHIKRRSPPSRVGSAAFLFAYHHRPPTRRRFAPSVLRCASRREIIGRAEKPRRGQFSQR